MSLLLTAAAAAPYLFTLSSSSPQEELCAARRIASGENPALADTSSESKNSILNADAAAVQIGVDENRGGNKRVNEFSKDLLIYLF